MLRNIETRLVIRIRASTVPLDARVSLAFSSRQTPPKVRKHRAKRLTLFRASRKGTPRPLTFPESVIPMHNPSLGQDPVSAEGELDCVNGRAVHIRLQYFPQCTCLTDETKPAPCCAGGTLRFSQHVLLDGAYVIERHGACTLHICAHWVADAISLSSL
jgi:hypothetical protein